MMPKSNLDRARDLVVNVRELDRMAYVVMRVLAIVDTKADVETKWQKVVGQLNRLAEPDRARALSVVESLVVGQTAAAIGALGGA